MRSADEQESYEAYLDYPDDSALDSLLRVERSADVERALSCLTVEQLAYVGLRYGFGYSRSVSARLVGIPLRRVGEFERGLLLRLRELME